MEPCIVQCRHALLQFDAILPRLTDEHRALEPCRGTKTAGWLIGHLAITGDFARRLCGAQALCPIAWRERFKPESAPSHDPATYPPMKDLCEKLQAVYRDLCEIAASADPMLLSKPCPLERVRAMYPTAGDFVAYLMSSHLAYHLGQLVTWCAAAGVSRVRASPA